MAKNFRLHYEKNQPTQATDIHMLIEKGMEERKIQSYKVDRYEFFRLQLRRWPRGQPEIIFNKSPSLDDEQRQLKVDDCIWSASIEQGRVRKVASPRLVITLNFARPPPPRIATISGQWHARTSKQFFESAETYSRKTVQNRRRAADGAKAPRAPGHILLSPVNGQSQKMDIRSSRVEKKLWKSHHLFKQTKQS